MSTGSQPSRRHGTIAEIRQRCLGWRELEDGRRIVAGSLYNRSILRPVSVRATWLLIRLGVGANTMTLVMILSGILGIAAAVPHNPWWTLCATIAFILFDLFDAVDGELARWYGVSSTRGLFLDKVAHLIVEHPNLAMAAAHLYVLTGSDVFLFLAMGTVIMSLLAKAVRETMFRINAEAQRNATPEPQAASATAAHSGSAFVRLCQRLRKAPIFSFPFTKPRIVQILTVLAVCISYFGPRWPLITLAVFYAAYITARCTMEIPYFYFVRVTNVPHTRKLENHRWPI